jgi:ABC-2 type transport system ATP-binding protein
MAGSDSHRSNLSSAVKTPTGVSSIPVNPTPQIQRDISQDTNPIRLINLSKWYGQVIGLNDVTISFPKGLTGLLGPNGAGKSTLLKCLTGQIKADIGKVFINNHNPWLNPSIWHFTGYCPEQEAFWTNITGYEFVLLLTKLQGYPAEEADRATKKAIGIMGMTEHMNRSIGGYSKGMKQRIKLAQCIVHDPEILVLDEPLAGTDPLARHHIIKLLRRWELEGKTMIISSHVLEEVERITDNIVLIHRGRLLADGKIDQIRGLIDKHPHHILIRTSDIKRLGERLIGESFVESVKKHTKPPGLMIETHQPNVFYSEIAKIILDEDITIEGMSSQDDSLDAVFRYLIG